MPSIPACGVSDRRDQEIVIRRYIASVLQRLVPRGRNEVLIRIRVNDRIFNEMRPCRGVRPLWASHRHQGAMALHLAAPGARTAALPHRNRVDHDGKSSLQGVETEGAGCTSNSSSMNDVDARRT